MSTKIIVDTSVWIEFFRHAESAVSLHVRSLLRSRQVILVGMVLAEIIQGVRNSREAKIVRQHFAALPFMEASRDAWERAGEISAGLRKNGITIPLSDLLIAAVALSEACEVFTLDPHFESVPKLRLHQALLKTASQR